MSTSALPTDYTERFNGLPSLSRKNCWRIALAAPAVVGPLWAASWLGHRESPLTTIAGAALLMLIATSACTDLARRRIYNWATYSALLWAIAINTVATFGESVGLIAALPLGGIGLTASLAGMTICFFVVMAAYNLAGGGAGDVKIAAAIGAFIGADLGVFAVAYAYIFAGAGMLAWLAWERGPLVLFSAFGRQVGSMLLPIWIASPNEEERLILNRPVPLGPYFFLGTLFVLL